MLIEELTPGQSNIIEGFQRRYNEPIKEDGVIGITSPYVLKDALERGRSTDREKLRNAIAETDLKMGEGGVALPFGVKFGPNGENMRATNIVDQNIKLIRTTVYPSHLASGKAVFPVPKWEQRK